MQVVYERCCGLDVHKKVVVACLIVLATDGQRHKKIRTFGTMTQDLLALLDWLGEAGCTHVALESTGVYWRPIFNILEGEMTVLLVNAAHIKAVPGRKTDIQDAEWIADLLQHGLLRPSFIPPAPQRELRELTRYRRSLVADCARVINRFQKVLEDTNLKLAPVVTDVTGVSARAILRAYLSGEETDPWELANLARGSLRGKQVQLAQAMVGEVKEHHRFLLLQQMALIEILEKQIAEFDQKIAEWIGQDEEEQETNQPPSLWASGKISNEYKKRLLRSLISRVIATRTAADRIELKIVWISGHYSVTQVIPPIYRQADVSNYQQLVSRLDELTSQGITDPEIAAQLTAEGFHTARQLVVTVGTIHRLRKDHGQVSSLHRHRKVDRIDGFWTLPGLTRELGVGQNWLYQRIYRGELTAPDVERLPNYRVYLIRNDPDLLARLKAEAEASRRYDTTRRQSHS